LSAVLYASYHAQAPLISSDRIRPIHVGCALARTPLEGTISDATGVNISVRNPSYCELTAVYWAWKNDWDSSHIGLMHYRRLLDFAGTVNADTAEVWVSELNISDYTSATEAWLDRHLADVDLVIPKPHKMGKSVAEHYRRGHKAEDFEAARRILAERHPDYLPDFDRVAQSKTLYIGNLFLMRRSLFEPYCDWLFNILDTLDQVPIDRSDYSTHQSRYLGFIAERLFTVFVTHLRRTRPNLKIQEVHILNLSDALVLPFMSGAALNKAQDINIAFSADRAYLPHTAAMLHSLLSYADRSRRINLFFLMSGIGPRDRALLREVLGVHSNAHLHEIQAGNRFKNSHRSRSRAPSNATYNRFLLFELLPDVDRLLYVDVDMIFLGDVAEIFDTDIGTAPLAAVRDHIMTRSLTGPTPTNDPKVPDLAAYHRTQLGLSDADIAGCVNAGLLLFNFAAMDVAETGRALIQEAATGRYLFRDQDILNKHFKSHVFHLPAHYMVLNTVEDGYNRVPHTLRKEALAAKRNPKIIHFADKEYKPWGPRAVPFAHHYWRHLIQTPFYAEVVSHLQTSAFCGLRLSPAAARARITSTGKALAEKVPALRPLLLRLHHMINR